MLFFKDDRGMETAEWAGMIAVVLVGVIAAFKIFGGSLQDFVLTLPAKLGIGGP